MKISSILLLSIVISMSRSDGTIQDAEDNVDLMSNKPKQRRLTFPKISLKFTVNPLHVKTTAPNVKEEIITRKPLMAKLIPKTKNDDIKYTDPVTRRPLMKLRTFTVTMRPKSINIEKLSEERKAKDSSKENESKTSEKNIQPQEEEQDRKEFIFLKNGDAKNVLNDLLDVSEEDIETTTKIISRSNRRKRSSNIIEEENLGTTIAGFKYTGRDTRLSSDLHYKNIHS